MCLFVLPGAQLLEMPPQVTKGTATWPPGSREPLFDFQGVARVRGLEGVPGPPGAPQDEAGLTRREGHSRGSKSLI